MDRAVLRTYFSQRMVHSPDIRTIRQRYDQGQISLDRFLAEAESRLRLMRLESQ